MNSSHILAQLAIFAAVLTPLGAHAEPDQKNNRGYVVGKGGVARAANEPRSDNNEPASTVPKQTQGATFGERVDAAPQQSGSAVATGAPQTAMNPSNKASSTELNERCQPSGNHLKSGADGAATATAHPSESANHRHSAAMSCVANVR